MRRIAKDVAKYGWRAVGTPPGENGAPECVFSIGFFETYRHPELVIFGLEPDTAHKILIMCYDRILEGAVFEAGQVRDDIVKHHSLAVMPVDRAFYPEYLDTATVFYGNLDFPVLQLVWPDKENRFPWDAAYDRKYAGQQVMLTATPS